MDSHFNRITSVFYTYMGALLTAAVSCHLTSYIWTPQPTASITFNKFHDFTANRYLGQDQANISFDLDLDLSAEFNWSTTNLFVYVMCKYETESQKLNEVIVWDTIVTTNEEAKVKLRDAKNKYTIKDFAQNLKNIEAKLEIRYRIMPIIGLVAEKGFSDESSAAFKFPSEYFRSEKKGGRGA